MTEEDYIREAIKEARIGKEGGEWPFGAVVVRGGEIIARAACTEGASKNIVDHAELRVLKVACTALGRNDLSDCAIYSTNEPCLMCACAIFQAKIGKVTFALARTDLPHLLRERKLRIHDLVPDVGFEVQMTQGILKDEALELFADVKK